MSGESPATGKGANLLLVDAHQHFQDLERHYYPWLCDRDRRPRLEGDIGPIRRNYLPADYARDTTGFDIRKTVHVQNGWNPADPVGETRWLQQLSAETGRPTAIVAFADLAAPGIEGVLNAHATVPALRGIRQILNWHADPALRVAAQPDLMEQTTWRRGFALLRRYGLSFDLQIYWPQMDMALALAQAHPDTVLVLNHFGMPIDRSAAGVAAWASAMARLARAPHVVAKLSGFGLGHPRWTFADTAPLLERVLAAFGPDRIMVGTNLPVDRLFAPGRAILGAISALAAGLSEAERRAVLSGTAERVYRV